MIAINISLVAQAGIYYDDPFESGAFDPTHIYEWELTIKSYKNGVNYSYNSNEGVWLLCQEYNGEERLEIGNVKGTFKGDSPPVLSLVKNETIIEPTGAVTN